MLGVEESVKEEDTEVTDDDFVIGGEPKTSPSNPSQEIDLLGLGVNDASSPLKDEKLKIDEDD